MRLEDWDGAVVSPAVDDVPSPPEWHPVELSGRPARFADADAVAYRTNLPALDADGGRALLTLSGVYGRATLWLDGELLGDRETHFQPARFAIESTDGGELVVVCRRPARFGGVYETDGVPADLAVPGIWWDAKIESRPESFVRDLRVRPRETTDGWAIDASVTVDAGVALDDRVTVSLRPEGFRGGGTMDRLPVAAEAGEVVTVETTLAVRDPRLWWPRGRGSQARYAVRAKLEDDARSATTGLRTVERDREGLVVNGERLRARGVGLLPGDDPGQDLDRALDANANLVRVRGHVRPPSFYEACDEAGLLVWQDLPLVGPTEYDRGRAREVAADLAAVTAGHPCVACYALHDDPVDVAAGLAGARLHRPRLRWRAWRTDAPEPNGIGDPLPDEVAVLPVVGQPGTGADATVLHPGWDFGGPSDVAWVLDRWPDLVAAVGSFGASALADGGTSGGDGTSDAAGFDPAKHAVHVPDGDVAASQAYQSQVVKRTAEALRLRESGIAVAAALRDADDGAGMGLLARDGTEKAAFRALAASFEPVQAMLDAWPEGGRESGVVVVNDSPEPVAGSVSWSADTVDGTAAFEMDGFGREEVGRIAVPDGGSEVSLSVNLGERVVENEYEL